MLVSLWMRTLAKAPELVRSLQPNHAHGHRSKSKDIKIINVNLQSYSNYKAHQAALSPVPKPLARYPFTMQDHRYGASASRGVPVYILVFAGTYCTYPRRDGQAELTWPRRFTCLPTVTNPSTNRAWRWLTLLMRSTMLPTESDHHHEMETKSRYLTWTKNSQKSMSRLKKKNFVKWDRTFQ